MPSPKRTDSLSKVFAISATCALSQREENDRRRAAEQRKAAAEQREAEKAAAAKKLQEEAHTREAATVLFPQIKSLYDKAFGENKTFKITTDGPSIQLDLQYPAYNHKDAPYVQNARFALKAFAKGGKFFYSMTGRDIDPQYRGYTQEVSREKLISTFSWAASHYGDTEGLKKLQKLSTAPQKKKPAPKR